MSWGPSDGPLTDSQSIALPADLVNQARHLKEVELDGGLAAEE
jgi:hypothetical protein